MKGNRDRAAFLPGYFQDETKVSESRKGYDRNGSPRCTSLEARKLETRQCINYVTGQNFTADAFNARTYTALRCLSLAVSRATRASLFLHVRVRVRHAAEQQTTASIQVRVTPTVRHFSRFTTHR